MASQTQTIRSLARSFAGGEVTPEFFGRVDDVKNLTGLATCRNFQILPHGPCANRAGTQFVKAVKDSTKDTRVIDFTYSDDQTFAIEVGHQYMRFHTFGATLLAGSPTAWSGATAYVVGDLSSRLGVNYYCILGHTNHQPPNATYWYAMPADGTFELPTPYQEADLFDLHYVQSEDVLTLTHPTYAVRELRRLGATNWVLSTVSFASELAAPTSIAATATVATGTGLVAMSYTVTAVDSTGREESLQGTPDDCNNNLLTTGNYNTITWNAVTGAARYNVYKQSNGLYGYIGQTDALTFKDDNITADIAKTPPIAQTPFGSTNNYPAAVTYHEQRRGFGGTNTLRQNIWLTRSGTESNLSYSIPTRDSDAISFKLKALKANTIRHLIPLNDLLVLTSSAVWKVTSVNSDSITPTSIAVKPQTYVGASNAQPIVASDSVIYAASRGGHVRELRVDVSGTSYKGKDLSLRAPHLFNNRQIVDMAVAQAPYPVVYFTSSNGYLLGLTYVPEEEIFPWYWYDSYTNDGAFDEEIGVTAQGARSLFKSVTVVTEDDEDAVYAVVERVINGSTVKYIERFSSRNFVTIEGAYFVDCGVSYDGNPQDIGAITKANPGVVTITAHGYSNGNDLDFSEMEGMEELEGQRVYVANKTANTFELVDEYGANINTTSYGTFISGVSREVVTSISAGISHLEGEAVAVLGNGAVQPKQIVTGGTITFDTGISRGAIGLPIEADIKTLPIAFEIEAFGQGRVKNVNQIWLRVNESSGIFAGPSFDKLTEKKQRTDETYGTPPDLVTGELPLTIGPSWGDSGAVCVRQSDPLPLTIVSMTLEVEVGS